MSAKKKVAKKTAGIFTPPKKNGVVVTKETVHPTSGRAQKPPKGGWSGTESVGTHRPRKRKIKTTTKKGPSIPAGPPKPKLSRKGPIAGATAIAAATALAPSKTKSYSIKGGDTLSQIAKRHGTTLKALLTANPQIKNANKIRVGQKIKLSKPVKGRKSVYQGMSKSEMAEIAKKKSGKVVKRAGGGMTRVGLSPAEMARAGTMSEAKRKRYMAKGGLVKRKHAGKVGPKEQSYNARLAERLGETQGKESSKKMSLKGREKVARATRKPKGSFGFKVRPDQALVHAQYS